MKVIRGGFGSRKSPSIGLVLGAGGVVGQAYQAGVLAALQRETGWDPRAATLIVGTSAGSVTGAALRVGVPATDLAASLYGVATSRRGGAILRRILPADAGPLPSPSVRSLLRPWNLPVARPHHPGGPAPAGLPARGGGHDPASPRADRHLRTGPWPRRAHRDALARRPAHLRRAALRRRPRRLRPARRPAGAAGPRRPGVVRHSGLLPTGHDRGHRVRRRRRLLGHQRGRAQIGNPRPRRDRLVHVGRPAATPTVPTACCAGPCTAAWNERSHGWSGRARR